MARMAFRTTWRAAALDAHLTAATKAGLNDTMRACVETAKQLAPVDTGALRDDIDFKPAEESGSRITGRWGNWTIPYAFFQEEGTSRNPAVRYLAQARDRHYPETSLRIRSHM